MELKWLKKWAYMLLLLGMGAVYLSCVDKWQVYAEPIAWAKGLYAELTSALLSPEAPFTGEGPDGGVSDGDNAGAVSGGDNAGTVSGGDGAGTVSGGDSAGAASGGDGAGPGENSGDGPDGGDSGAGDGNGDAAAEPVYETVEDDYFADAVFIGDSRTVGMYEYGGLEETAAFYASTGLTVYKLFDSAIVTVPGQKKKITVEEALEQNSFRKIYLMIGINEMGTGTVETFAEKYQEVVNRLLELQPDAILYLQGIMKVTTERSEQGDYITNEGIDARNEAISRMADNKRVFYLDVNPEICDGTGGMTAAYTFDGVHLKAQYVEIWKNFLKSHAVVPVR